MARQTPPGRLGRLVECATRVFIEQGYRRTQMADIAEALGVAKGTLYLYVASKDALFDLVARCADGEDALPELSALPLRTPPAGKTIAYVRDVLAANRDVPALAKALQRTRVGDVRAELAEIVGELYDVLARHRCGIKLIDRSAIDHPELGALWFDGARNGMCAALAAYLEAPTRRRRLRSVADVSVTARMILETVVFWAVHRHWDPHPQSVDESCARAAVIEFIVNAVVSSAPPRSRRNRS